MDKKKRKRTKKIPIQYRWSVAEEIAKEIWPNLKDV